MMSFIQTRFSEPIDLIDRFPGELIFCSCNAGEITWLFDVPNVTPKILILKNFAESVDRG
jgi:hypothetical protein